MSNNNDLLDPSTSTDIGNKQLPNATATLVLGICSIVGCLFYGIPGLICGIIALFLHKKDKMIYSSDPSVYESSFKNSKAGFICAIIGISLSALYFIIALLAIIFAFSAFGIR